MIELLVREQQELVINHLTKLINTYLGKKHIYVILEPTEKDEINDIFLKAGISYTEPVALFDDRLEDVGPRISELGKNDAFDRWIIEKAVFNRWTCLFVSDADLDTFTEQISYLCNAVTFEHKPVIFRMYPPVILNEWLMALQKENQSYCALGICSDIFYAIDSPDKIAHYHFENNMVTRLEIDLINHITHEITVPVEIEITDIQTHKKWLITENQVNSLSYARAYHLIHELHKNLLSIPLIQKNYSPLEVHRQLIQLINLCFQYNIKDVFFISEFAKLYFANKKRWESNQEVCIKILQSSQPEVDKLENIAMLLK
ncbi:DUF4123 domain-containing protein [Aggregatibacter actinomycetemcomitans]|uniref:DUF4123 domain-containing protein n=1 Tax=Aggregatibacter actinomycetemcomitans TaxID=714 RepID=UPI00197C1749|nr:DUF4123 domain-containing protein [Aggregatibacter actinomycetemcomitans]MBN6068179.1 DUF4123 domain-containing protein [Aggregatibacter actinomycetemcomitans]MBN6085366.1 DUF4123 domain-containing protein [Aggregatibacter actinomycetemcomitans]